jgi:hypothetical protein
MTTLLPISGANFRAKLNGVQVPLVEIISAHLEKVLVVE